MAAAIVRCKGGRYYLNLCAFVSSPWPKGYIVSGICELHTSQSFQIDRRKDKAIVQHLHFRDHEKSIAHRNLPIHQLPDYSYIDGRPTEVAACQKLRQEKNYQLASQIVKLVGEIKFAQEQYTSQINDATNKKQARLDSRLKEKGTHE